MSSPTWEQVHFRIRWDDGSETTASWVRAEDENCYKCRPLRNYRLRFTMSLTIAAETSEGFYLYYTRNGGSPARVGTGADIYINSALSPNFADGDSTTRQLTLVNAFDTTNLGMDENGAIAAQPWAKNTSFEAEFCTQFTAAVSPGDYFDFQVYRDDGTTTNITYTKTPRLTIIKNEIVNIISNVG